MKNVPVFVLAIAAACASMARAAVDMTPAEIGIQKAQEQLAKQPGHVPYCTSLAMAYARRARESSDVAYYSKAHDTLEQCRKIDPNSFEVQKVETWLLLGRHEFAKALVAARSLNQRAPDDISVYGYLADANAELGNYDDAVKAAQWMLNLRPGNVAGLTRAAYLRELHGDLTGAMDLMRMAYDATPFQESEDRAWLLTQIAHLHLLSGNVDEAGTYAGGALGLFPGYHYALGMLAQVRLRQNRFDDAVSLLETRYAAAPHAENLFALAKALKLAGREEDAAKAFATFEQKALVESKIADNANHELIAYYVDYAHNSAKALELATEELARRHDAFTLDAYAWSLAASGDYTGADSAMKKALAFGVRDPDVLRHANEIAQRVSHLAALPQAELRNWLPEIEVTTPARQTQQVISRVH